MGFFRYPGGKSKVADKIIKVLAELADDSDVEYREPFFGGGSVGLKYLHETPTLKRLWINDKDIGIACLWTAVIRHHNELKKHVQKYKPDVSHFNLYKEELLGISQMPDQDNQVVETGFKKIAIHQISYSGLGTMSGGPLGGVKQESDYKIDCRWSSSHICKRIDELHDRLTKVDVRHGRCTNLDFADLIEDEDRPSILYLDPPYFQKGEDLYQHGFEGEHERLASALKKTKHLWVLSYDDCPQIRAMYDWGHFHPLNVNYSITACKDKDTGKRLSRTKPEVLICPIQLKGVGCENGIVPTGACAAGIRKHRNGRSCTAGVEG